MQKKKKKKKRKNFVVLAELLENIKQIEKIDKYSDLAREIKKVMEHVRVSVILIVVGARLKPSLMD